MWVLLAEESIIQADLFDTTNYLTVFMIFNFYNVN